MTYYIVMLNSSGRVLGGLRLVPPRELLYAWKRWDVLWYITIAHLGYWREQAAAFFPLYPMLIKGATFVIGERWMLAAMAVANLGTLLAASQWPSRSLRLA